MQPPQEPKRDSFADVAQTEFLALYNKAKKSVTRGREKFRKHDKLVSKRSQSTPNQLTEEELIESFRKAQLLESQRSPRRSSSFRKYSTDSSLRSTTPERVLPKPTKRFVSQRKPQRPTSRKIIEIIDPKSFDEIFQKTAPSRIPILGLLKTLSTFSLLDLIKCYRIFKAHKKREHEKIRVLRNRCVAELLLIMIYCGLGGVMFKFVEGAFESFYKCGVKRVKRDFIELLWYKSHNLREEDWKSLARNKLRKFEEELHQAHEAGMHSYSGQRSWSFLNGVVYTLTVITTIGKILALFLEIFGNTCLRPFGFIPNPTASRLHTKKMKIDAAGRLKVLFFRLRAHLSHDDDWAGPYDRVRHHWDTAFPDCTHGFWKIVHEVHQVPLVVREEGVLYGKLQEGAENRTRTGECTNTTKTSLETRFAGHIIKIFDFEYLVL